MNWDNKVGVSVNSCMHSLLSPPEPKGPSTKGHLFPQISHPELPIPYSSRFVRHSVSTLSTGVIAELRSIDALKLRAIQLRENLPESIVQLRKRLSDTREKSL